MRQNTKHFPQGHILDSDVSRGFLGIMLPIQQKVPC